MINVVATARTASQILGKSASNNQNMIRVFSPSLHMWLNAKPILLTAPQLQQKQPSQWQVKFGLTERGFDDIGDIERIQRCVPPNNSAHSITKESILSMDSNREVLKGQELLQISWHGHRITQADELYHTVWETIEEDFLVQSPVEGEVIEVATENCWERFGTDMWLAKILIQQDALSELLHHGDNAGNTNIWGSSNPAWVDENEYNKRVEAMPAGVFADE